MNIAFLGLGNYGQAIASLVAHNGHSYDYADVSEGRLLTEKADVVFLTLPTGSIRQALQENRNFIGTDTIIVNCSKGIERDTHLLAHQVVQDVGTYGDYCNLMGPSFAAGIVAREPTVISLGYTSSESMSDIRKLIGTPYFAALPTTDYQVLELASALKNIYAIVCGYAAGLGYGPNVTVYIVTRALKELETLAQALGLPRYDATLPGVMGDLILTCMSGYSRNYLYGKSLADTSAQRIDPSKITVEGYHASFSIAKIAKNTEVELPIAGLVQEIVSGRVFGKQDFGDYLTTVF